MTGRAYPSAAAFKQAVEHRLREQAAAEGVGLARSRQFLVFDRFIARLAAVLGNRMILKGGLVVELRLRRARSTKDVDIRLTGGAENTLERLQESGRIDLRDFLQFEVRDDPRHPVIEAEGMRDQGRRYRVHAMLAGKIYGSPFGVDVAFADPLTGEIEEIEGSRLLDFAGVEPARFRIYPLETHIAEKLHAYTMPRKRPNSRVKDLPDIALLATARAMQAGVLRSAIHSTFGSRGIHDVPAELPAPPALWAPVYERMARTDGLRWKTLDELARAAAAFLDPLLSGCEGTWDPDGWEWTRDKPGRGLLR